MRGGPLAADEVLRAAGIDPSSASAALIELELTGRVTLEDGAHRVAV